MNRVDTHIPVNSQYEPRKDSLFNVAKEMPFEVGAHFRAVGQGVKTGIAELDNLGLLRHHVCGDGSCWARALWQNVFAQVFSDDQSFFKFIEQIEALPEEIPFDLKMGTLHILYELKIKGTEERIEYLNHQNVDDTLIFFMRHVAAEYMLEKRWVTTTEANNIKVDKSQYGARETTAFARQFGLGLTLISKKENRWHYYEMAPGETRYSKIIPVESIDRFQGSVHTMFGVNSYHFEFLSVPFAGEKKPPSDQALDELAKQIEDDAKVAREMQEQYNQEAKQIKDDQAHAKALQKKLDKDLRQMDEDKKLAEKLQSQESSMDPIEEPITERVPEVKKSQEKKNPIMPKAQKKRGFFASIKAFFTRLFRFFFRRS